MIKIEKNIPFPKAKIGAGYPWHEMEIGDSFLIAGKQHSSNQRITSNHNKNGKRFISRLVPGGTRIWRVE